MKQNKLKQQNRNSVKLTKKNSVADIATTVQFSSPQLQT